MSGSAEPTQESDLIPRLLPRLMAKARGAITLVQREILKFGAVGAVAFVIDVGGFNLLTTGLWPGSGEAPFVGHEKLAKIISAGVAILVAWIGNRLWTFRHRRQATPVRELVLFVVMNLVGVVIAVVCLHISHDILGFTSTLANNISGNVIGVGLGTLFRFWAYRKFVFNSELGKDFGEVPGLPAERTDA